MTAHLEIHPAHASKMFSHSRLVGWLDAILNDLADSKRQTRTALALLAVYVAIWTIYGTLSKGSQDVHFDMGEAVVWAHQGWLTAPKHPPLSGWLPGLWFSVFPRQDWLYYLLAMVSAGVGLWSAWLLSRRYLTGDKLSVSLLLLGFVPFYNFHALKYNANTVMIPLWGLATYAFLRSYQTRLWGWAVLAGIAAAAVMLGKYWGVILLAALGLCAVLDARRAEYFRSAAPWITIVAGTAVLAPHLMTLADSHGETVLYALNSHVKGWTAAWLGAPKYLGAVLAYVSVPIGIVALLSRGDRAVIADTLAPRDPDRRMALLIVVLPVVLPILIASLAASDVNALWTMGGFALLPAVLLSSPRLQLTRQAARVILLGAIIFPVVLLAASPLIALKSHFARANSRTAHAQQVAKEIETRWAMVSPQKLRLLGGETSLINSTAFYLRHIPTTLDVKRPAETPWITDADIKRDGIALICESDDAHCIENATARVHPFAPEPPQTFSLTRRYMGFDGTPQPYTLLIVPPEAGER